MEELNFINNSNDANNSQIVIFQQNDSLPGGPEVAVHLISLSKGSTASVPVPSDVNFHVAVITPAITVNGGVMKIEENFNPYSFNESRLNSFN